MGKPRIGLGLGSEVTAGLGPGLSLELGSRFNLGVREGSVQNREQVVKTGQSLTPLGFTLRSGYSL